MNVYLDNAATSFPKPNEVIEAMTQALLNGQGNANRSLSKEAMVFERAVYETRMLLCEFFNFDAVDHVIFTKNVTESLNVILLGFLEEGDLVLTSTIEHNAVMRPLEHLRKSRSITYKTIPLTEGYALDLEALEEGLKKNPKLVVVTSGSNLTGDYLNLEAIGGLCAQYKVPLVVDAAQAAGVLPIDMKKAQIAALAFTGHKSLLGPQGMGGFLVEPDFAKNMKPLLYGGTGSASDSLIQPEIMPDKFESGTGNTPGILGLKAALEFLMAKENPYEIFEHKVAMIERLQNGVKNLQGVVCLGNPDPKGRLGVLALDFQGFDNSEVAYLLNKNYGISTRVGMHCAPMAHETYGSYPQGAVRFSVSYATRIEEIDYTVDALAKILKEGVSYG